MGGFGTATDYLAYATMIANQGENKWESVKTQTTQQVPTANSERFRGVFGENKELTKLTTIIGGALDNTGFAILSSRALLSLRL